MNPVFTGADPDELWPLIRQFHYSRRMPGNIQHCYTMREPGGLFGDRGEPVAGIIFSWAQAKWPEEVLELARLVRNPTYSQPLTQLIALSCDWLKKSNHTLVISYADWTQRHHGGIYQAAGWHYGGMRERDTDGVIINGQFHPGRSCNAAWGTRSATKLRQRFPNTQIDLHYDDGKYIYWKPLTFAGRKKAKKLNLEAFPYPKPNAARPADERPPGRASKVQPLGAAPQQEAP